MCILGDLYFVVSTGCIYDLHSPQETVNHYVEVTLSGCKYLCEFLHDLTCTLLVWIPSQRSCILKPLEETSSLYDAKASSSCLYAEIIRRQRKTGKGVVGVFAHSVTQAVSPLKIILMNNCFVSIIVKLLRHFALLCTYVLKL